MIRTVGQKAEVDEYRKELVSYIAQRELKDKAFTRWLCYFDDNKEDFYVHLPGSGQKAEGATGDKVDYVQAEILN